MKIDLPKAQEATGSKPESEATLRADYYRLLERRKKLDARLGYLMQRANTDTDLLLSLDKEKHDVHVRAQEIGRKLGKTLTEMDFDVMMLHGNASDLGLEAPIIFPESNATYHRESKKIFEMMKLVEEVGDTPDKLPLFQERLRELTFGLPKNSRMSNKMLIPSDYLPSFGDYMIDNPVLPDEVVLIYGEQKHFFDDTTFFSANFSKRMIGLKNLTEEFPKEVRMFASGDLSSHETNRLYGVAIDRSQLVEMVQKIMSNRSEYWTTFDDENGTRETIYTFSEIVGAMEDKVIPFYLRDSYITEEEKQLVKQYWKQEIQRLFELYQSES